MVLAIGLILLLISAFNIPNFKLEASSDSLVLENDDDLRYILIAALQDKVAEKRRGGGLRLER